MLSTAARLARTQANLVLPASRAFSTIPLMRMRPPAGRDGGANAAYQPSFETDDREEFARVAAWDGVDIARAHMRGEGRRMRAAREKIEDRLNVVVHAVEAVIPGHTELGAQQVKEELREGLRLRMNRMGRLLGLGAGGR